MHLRQIVVDAHDPETLVRFWGSLLGGTPVGRGHGEFHLDPPGSPRFVFRPAGASGARPGRLDFDLTVATADDRGGFRSVRDPEGHEFRIGVAPPVPPGTAVPGPPLPGAVAKARVLFTDGRGRVLLVRLQPWHDACHWGLPGGTVEAGTETPRRAAVREIEEEIGLPCVPGRLLGIDWVHRAHDRPRLVHVFDGGPLADEDLKRVRLDAEELAEWRMCTPREAEALLLPPSWEQLKESLAVLASGTGPAELVDGVPAHS
ncbi:NUDIX domain-containing protein [Streptomyces sp. NBC_00247]|uniref:NUDIX domain-containing protein n=1 Tax=Streptomyces sp. NBC_00247 TaxID=2975689 RepID=UPI002E2E06DF|nr:NUDIX domain-containing protein [Streptomyces sp. NBC_00247]